MLSKTEGIVIHTLKYSDNSIIVRFFTKDHGILSCMVKGVNAKKSTFKKAFFQPLTVLEMNLIVQENKNFQILKEIHPFPELINIHTDVYKSTVAIFIAEILYKTTKEGYINSTLFELLRNQVFLLSEMQQGYSLFTLKLLIQLMGVFGFSPIHNFDEWHPVFSIQDGAFIPLPDRPDPHFHFSTKSSLLMHQLLSNHEPDIDGAIRFETLNGLIQYFQFHLPGMGNVKSLAVLREIFHT